MKLLIVEDEKIIRDGLKAMIARGMEGEIDLLEASNGAVALQLAQTVRPDVILLDICMPIMDGITFLKRYSADGGSAKVIILSGHNEFDYARSALQCGAFDYLLKPIQRDVLYSTLRSAIAVCEREQDRTLLQQQLNAAVIRERKNDLKQLICTPGSKISLNDYLDRRSISFEYPYFFVMNVTVNETADVSQPYDAVELLEICINEMDNVFCVRYNERNVVAIAGSNGEFSGAMIEKLQSLADRFRKQGNTIVYSFSSHHALSEVPYTLFREAKNAGMERLADKTTCMFFTAETASQKDHEPEQDWIKVFRQYAEQASNTEFKGFLEHYFSERSSVKSYINHLCFYILNLVMESNGAGNGMEQAAIIRQFSDGVFLCQNMEELNSFFIDTAHMVCRHEAIPTGEAQIHKCIFQAQEYIEQHYREDIAIGQIAEFVGMNASYLSVLFKRETHISLINYLNNIRIEQALRLLQNPRMKIYDIAFLVGYHDEKYFSRVFKKKVGISPAEYRERV